MPGPSPVKDAVLGPAGIIHRPFFTKASGCGFGILVAFQQSYDQAGCFSAVIGPEASDCRSAMLQSTTTPFALDTVPPWKNASISMRVSGQENQENPSQKGQKKSEARVVWKINIWYNCQTWTSGTGPAPQHLLENLKTTRYSVFCIGTPLSTIHRKG